MKKDLRLTNGVRGDGLWGAEGCVVHGVLRFRVTEPDEYITDGYAEGRFYLDKWDAYEDDMIYTDSLFINDLQKNLKELQFKHWEEIDYSEAGMQGENYVSMDASYELAKEATERGYTIDYPSCKGPETKGDKWMSDRSRKEILEECAALLQRAIDTC
jgi:hypothetical protein